MLVIKNRNRFAPVTLTTKHRIALFEIYFALTDFIFLNLINHFLFCIYSFQSIQKRGVDIFPFTFKSFLRNISAGNHFNDFEVEIFCKTIIAAVMTGNSHHCAGSISSQNIFANPNWNLFSGERMNDISARKYAGDFFHFSHALTLTSVLSVEYIFFHTFFVRDGSNLIYKFMLRSQG